MRIGIPKERRAGERRIAASVDMVKKLSAMGASVTIESGAGTNAGSMRTRSGAANIPSPNPTEP